MGGRIRGEASREEKIEMRNCVQDALWTPQATETGDVAIAIAATQKSKQQPAVWSSLGQQDLCAAQSD
jgi:hypothetical protein